MCMSSFFHRAPRKITDEEELYDGGSQKDKFI